MSAPGLRRPPGLETHVGRYRATSVPNPAVLIIDDGELCDVNRMLEQAGAHPKRLPGEAAQRGWRQPQQLLVVTGHRALTLARPIQQEQEQEQEQEGFKTLAVFEEGSSALVQRLRHMGFDHIVRRPVHPEALRLLVVGALYGQHEKRSEPRRPFGCEASWRHGWRRGRATVSEISSRGCSMQLPKGARPVSRFRLRIPPGAAGIDAPLTLPGRVIGYRPRKRTSAPVGANLSVLFDEIDLASRQRLAALLAGLELGPPTLSR
jgi:hypothetical protein